MVAAVAGTTTSSPGVGTRYDGVNGSPAYGMVQESNEGNNISDPVSVTVSGASVSGEEAPLPGSGPRPAPTAGP